MTGVATESAAPLPAHGLAGLLAVVWLLVIASALLVIYSTHQSRQLTDALEKQAQEQNRLDVEWYRLQLERSTLASMAEVERLARTRLGLVAPAANDIRVIRR